jgi:hypothetical protein
VLGDCLPSVLRLVHGHRRPAAGKRRVNIPLRQFRSPK